MAIANAAQFGATVRAERKRRGLTQHQLAAQAGVSRAWLARFETGHPAASIEQIFRVLDCLNLSITLVERIYTAGERAVS